MTYCNQPQVLLCRHFYTVNGVNRDFMFVGRSDHVPLSSQVLLLQYLKGLKSSQTMGNDKTVSPD